MAFPMPMRWGRLYKGTPAELSLEDAVATLGVPYRTQFPGYLYGLRYFPDFFLPTLGLVIEVDDPGHFKPEKMLEDAERTAELETHGWKVVRCTNAEALSDPHGTVKRLMYQAGYKLPLDIRTPSLASSLPVPKKAPQKNRREAASQARQAKRTKGH